MLLWDSLKNCRENFATCVALAGTIWQDFDYNVCGNLSVADAESQ